MNKREDNVELAFQWNNLECKPISCSCCEKNKWKPTKILFQLTILELEEKDSMGKYISKKGIITLKSYRGWFSPSNLETHFETFAKGRFNLRVQKKNLNLDIPWIVICGNIKKRFLIVNNWIQFCKNLC